MYVYIFTHIHTKILEKEMSALSSILAWEIPWTEKPGGLELIGLQRVRHDLGTSSNGIHKYTIYLFNTDFMRT